VIFPFWTIKMPFSIGYPATGIIFAPTNAVGFSCPTTEQTASVNKKKKKRLFFIWFPIVSKNLKIKNEVQKLN
jgi:hypothetical protein